MFLLDSFDKRRLVAFRFTISQIIRREYFCNLHRSSTGSKSTERAIAHAIRRANELLFLICTNLAYALQQRGISRSFLRRFFTTEGKTLGECRAQSSSQCPTTESTSYTVRCESIRCLQTCG